MPEPSTQLPWASQLLNKFPCMVDVAFYHFSGESPIIPLLSNHFPLLTHPHISAILEFPVSPNTS